MFPAVDHVTAPLDTCFFHVTHSHSERHMEAAMLALDLHAVLIRISCLLVRNHVRMSDLTVFPQFLERVFVCFKGKVVHFY